MSYKVTNIKVSKDSTAKRIELISGICFLALQALLLTFLILGPVKLGGKTLSIIGALEIGLDFTSRGIVIMANLGMVVMYYLFVGFSIKNLVMAIINLVKYCKNKESVALYATQSYYLKRIVADLLVVYILSRMLGTYNASALTTTFVILIPVIFLATIACARCLKLVSM